MFFTLYCKSIKIVMMVHQEHLLRMLPLSNLVCNSRLLYTDRYKNGLLCVALLYTACNNYQVPGKVHIKFATYLSYLYSWDGLDG